MLAAAIICFNASIVLSCATPREYNTPELLLDGSNNPDYDIYKKIETLEETIDLLNDAGVMMLFAFGLLSGSLACEFLQKKRCRARK